MMKKSITLLIIILGLSLILNFDCGTASSVYHEELNNEKIPIRARKAGGGRGRKYGVEHSDATSEPEVTKHIVNQPVASQSDVETVVIKENDNFIPVRARKAGGRRPKMAETTSIPQIKDNASIKDYGVSEEKNCPKEEFWHIRGKRCVSFECLYGRDTGTGECLWGRGMRGNGNRRIGGGYRSSLHNQRTFGLGKFGTRPGGKKGR